MTTQREPYVGAAPKLMDSSVIVLTRMNIEWVVLQFPYGAITGRRRRMLRSILVRWDPQTAYCKIATRLATS